MHWPGIRPEKYGSMFKDRCCLARSETTAQIEFWSTHVIQSKVAHDRVLLGAHNHNAVSWITCTDPAQQFAPVLLAPVFGLHLGSRAADEERSSGQITERRPRHLPLRWRKAKVPACEIIRRSIPQISHPSSQPPGFGFVHTRARVWFSGDISLCGGQADDAPDARCPLEEPSIPLDSFQAAQRHQIHQNIRVEAADFQSQSQ